MKEDLVVGGMSLVLNIMNLRHLLVHLVEDLQETGTWKKRLEIWSNPGEIKECGREGFLMHGLPPKRISQASLATSSGEISQPVSAFKHTMKVRLRQGRFA